MQIEGPSKELVFPPQREKEKYMWVKGRNIPDDYQEWTRGLGGTNWFARPGREKKIEEGREYG